MLLEGACHCRAVRFSVRSREPYPYMYCYCSICRKTGGGGGYAINISADAESLEVHGKEHLSIYQVTPEGGAYEAALEIAVSFAAEVDPAAAAHAKRLITFGWGAPTQTARHMEYLADMS